MADVIVLVSCGKTKHDRPTVAENLYRGPLFVKSLSYARNLSPKAIYILSAKYGLLELGDRVKPYEMTLNGMSSYDKAKWASDVLANLHDRCNIDQDRFIFLAGANYRKYLEAALLHSEAPLAGLGLGRQLSWLSRNVQG